MNKLYKFIIVLLLVVVCFLFFLFYIFSDTLKNIEYTVDIGINKIYETDLKNDIILNEDSINILKNIDDITNYFYVSNLLRILKNNGTNDIILK